MREKLSAETKLVLLCSRMEPDDAAREEILSVLALKPDWQKVTGLAGHHKVLPLLCRNLLRFSPPGAIPGKILDLLKDHYHVNLARNIRIQKEMTAIFSRSAGITSPVPFKGFGLLQTVYARDPGLRMLTDVDLLDDGTGKISGILAGLGYEGFAGNHGDTTVFNRQVSANLNLVIDVHTALGTGRPYRIHLPLLMARTRMVNVDGTAVPCLSDEDSLLGLALHMRRHTRKLTLKFFVDIAESLNAGGDRLDWDYIRNAARENHISSTLHTALYLAQELLDARIPREAASLRPGQFKSASIRALVNRGNFFSLGRKGGTLLRLLLFDRLGDLMLYSYRISLRERVIKRHLAHRTR